MKKEMTVAYIERLLQQREPFYAQADLRITTSGRDLDKIVREIIQLLQDRDVLPAD